MLCILAIHNNGTLWMAHPYMKAYADSFSWSTKLDIDLLCYFITQHLLLASLWVSWVQSLWTCQEGEARILPQYLLCCYSTIRTTVVERVSFYNNKQHMYILYSWAMVRTYTFRVDTWTNTIQYICTHAPRICNYFGTFAWVWCSLLVIVPIKFHLWLQLPLSLIFALILTM